MRPELEHIWGEPIEKVNWHRVVQVFHAASATISSMDAVLKSVEHLSNTLKGSDARKARKSADKIRDSIDNAQEAVEFLQKLKESL